VGRRTHKDQELKPPAAALVALQRWLDSRGAYRAELVEALGVPKSFVSRLFAGEAYLGAKQRKALEKLTAGVVTAAILAGEQKVPKPLRSPRAQQRPITSAEVDEPAAAPVHSAPTDVAPNDVAAIMAKLAPGVVPQLVRDAMVACGYVKDPKTGEFAPVKSEALRQRTREWLMEHLHGKARQRDRDEREAPPERDEDLIIELNNLITGARRRLEKEVARAKAEEERQKAAAIPAVPGTKPAAPAKESKP